MVGTLLVALLSDQRAAEVASYLISGETKTSKSYELSTIPWTCRQGYTVQFKQSYSFLSWALLVRIVNFSEALILVHSCCLLSCSLSVTFKPTCTPFASFSSSPCSRSYYLLNPLAPGPYWHPLCLAGSLSRSSQRHARCLLPSWALLPRASFIHGCCSSGIMLSMHNKTVHLNYMFLSPHMPILVTGSNELPLNEQVCGSFTLTPNH